MEIRLTSTQRDAVLHLWRKDRSVSQIAKTLGLTREYVQAYVRYLNMHPEFKETI